MALEYPSNPVAAPKRFYGDVEVDAFSGETRIVNVPPGVGGAPSDSQYLLGAADADLPNSRVAVDSATITVNYSVAGQVSWDAVGGGGGLPSIADKRVLGNDSGASATPTDTTVHQVLDWLVSDALWIFDGVDDRAEFGDFNDFDFNQAFTISAWIQTPSVAAQQVIAGKLEGTPGFRGWEIGIESPGRLYFFFASNNSVAGTTIVAQTNSSQVPVGGLVHVAATYNGSGTRAGVTLYINGAVSAIDTGVGAVGNLTTTTLSTQAMEVGVRAATNTLPFTGLIQHLAIFPSALTAGNITTIYNGGTPGDLSGLSPQFWAKFDSSDTTAAGGIADYGSGNHDGTAAGGLGPAAPVGTLPVRSTAIWQGLPPSTSGLPLTSNGIGFLPSYRQIALTGLPSMSAKSVLANATNATATPTALAGSAAFQYLRVNSANNALEFATLSGHASTSITYTSDTFQRAALTGVITAGANSNTTAFAAAAAKTVLANATNASAVPTFVAGSAAFQYLRVNSANTALEWATITVASPITQTTGTIGFDQTVALGNNARVAVNKNSGATVGTRRRLNFIEGSNVTLTIADDAVNEEVDITVAAASATINSSTISVFGTPASTGIPFVIYVTFTAGTPGTADDVTIFSANAPFNFRILEAWLVTATAIGGSTVTARTATGGLGSALTTDLSSTATGKFSDNSTATTTVASGGTVVLRRSDRGVAGEFFFLCVRT